MGEDKASALFTEFEERVAYCEMIGCPFQDERADPALATASDAIDLDVFGAEQSHIDPTKLARRIQRLKIGPCLRAAGIAFPSPSEPELTNVSQGEESGI